MDNSQAKQFGDKLTAVFEVYGKDAPSKNVKTMWWGSLANFDLPVVISALGLHVNRCEYFPKPADILKIISSMDGRPDAEEAWALSLKGLDEGDTVMWTQEMAASWAISQQIMASGDSIGARMAFRQHYERLLQNSRESGVRVKWELSLGHDASRRNEAITQAVNRGLISQDKANHFLVAEITSEGRELAGMLGYSGDKVIDHPAKNEMQKKQIEALRKSLADGTALADARKQQAKYNEKLKIDSRRELLISQSRGAQ